MLDANCIFCKIVQGQIPSTKIFEDDDTLVFLDIKPINPGHALVVPKQHTADMLDTADAVLGKLMAVAKKIGAAQLANGAEAFNTSVNNGAAAGQVVFHLHLHVIPRYTKDRLSGWVHKDYRPGESESVAAALRSKLAL